MASISLTIRQDNGVSVSLSADPPDADLARIIETISEFFSDYPVSVGSRPSTISGPASGPSDVQ